MKSDGGSKDLSCSRASLEATKSGSDDCPTQDACRIDVATLGASELVNDGDEVDGS